MAYRQPYGRRSRSVKTRVTSREYESKLDRYSARQRKWIWPDGQRARRPAMVQDNRTPEPEVGGGEAIRETQSYENAPPTVELPVVVPRSPSSSSPVDVRTDPTRFTARPRVVAARSQRTTSHEHDRSRPASPFALRLVVVFLAVCAISGTGFLVALHAQPKWFMGLRNVVTPIPVSHSSTTRPTTTTTLPSAVGAGNLAISALEPPTGASGIQVTIVGSGLFGPGGYVAATFAGSIVPTSCPNETKCVVTVPPAATGTTAIVRIETHGGTSNGLLFRYQ
jgi:hypothetical protein